MKHFAKRRTLSIVATVAVGLLLVAILRANAVSLHRPYFLSGWILAAAVVFLALFNVRKKLPFLPGIGRGATWLQIHVYVGWLSILLFLTHTGFRLPGGFFDVLLGATFAAVAGSGVFGLYFSRSIARRLTSRGEEILYERIPTVRRRLRERVESLVFAGADEARSATLPEFYSKRLVQFLDGPSNFWLHLVDSNRPAHALRTDFSSLERYLNKREREILDEVRDLALLKNDLDYNHALQSTLKYWLFVHIPLTYALLVFLAVHLILVHAFVGGAA